MKDQVTPEQARSYQENGFLVIEGFLDAEETAHWGRTTDEAVAQRLASTSSALNNQGDPDDYYAQVFTQCLKLADSHAGMRALRASAGTRPICSKCIPSGARSARSAAPVPPGAPSSITACAPTARART